MKTTAKDFKLFKKWFKYYAFDVMGLKNYDVYFKHENIGDAAADIETNVGGQVSLVRLNKVKRRKCKSRKMLAKDIKRSAFHEACELLLTRMNMVAQNRYVSEDELNEASHEIIRVMEHEWLPRI